LEHTYFTLDRSIPFLSDFDLVDINCGCPSLKITGNQAGSYLLKRPEKIADMVKTLKNLDIPVTAKIRLGYKSNNVLRVSRILEKAGVDAITLHARLAINGSSIPADWNQIKMLKNQIGVPVIGNGDITSGESVSRMLDIADGIMIARAAIGNPLIFRNIQHYLRTGKEIETNKDERLNCLREYIDNVKKNEIDLSRVKYVCSNFLRGFRGANILRANLMKIRSLDQIEKIIKEIDT